MNCIKMLNLQNPLFLLTISFVTINHFAYSYDNIVDIDIRYRFDQSVNFGDDIHVEGI